jgi:predicted SnoaL-like aldol condensation-catalyzing enzyme
VFVFKSGQDFPMSAVPKAVVRRFLDDSRDSETGEWRVDVIAECFDIDRYFSHTWGAGLGETGRRMGEFFAAFGPAVEVISDTLIAEGEFVVHHRSWRTEHVGAVLGVEATGRTVEMNHVEMWRVENGKIVEHWGGVGEAWRLYEQITGTG